jgi:hypothetical protein
MNPAEGNPPRQTKGSEMTIEVLALIGVGMESKRMTLVIAQEELGLYCAANDYVGWVYPRETVVGTLKPPATPISIPIPTPMGIVKPAKGPSKV